MCVFVRRTLCFAGVKPSSYHVDDHLYAPLPVAYLERGVTSLGDEASDNDVSEGAGAMRVTYTSSGCCVSPVRAADSINLDRHRPPHDSTGAMKTRQLLCCRGRQQVGC